MIARLTEDSWDKTYVLSQDLSLSQMSSPSFCPSCLPPHCRQCSPVSPAARRRCCISDTPPLPPGRGPAAGPAGSGRAGPASWAENGTRTGTGPVSRAACGRGWEMKRCQEAASNSGQAQTTAAAGIIVYILCRTHQNTQ